MKFKFLIGLFMMLGLSVGVNAQSFLAPADAVAAIEDAVINIGNYAVSVDAPVNNDDQVNNAGNTVPTDAQIKTAFAAFLTEIQGSIKTLNDTQAGYNDVVARFSANANTTGRIAGLDAAKDFALTIIAN